MSARADASDGDAGKTPGMSALGICLVNQRTGRWPEDGAVFALAAGSCERFLSQHGNEFHDLGIRDGGRLAQTVLLRQTTSINLKKSVWATSGLLSHELSHTRCKSLAVGVSPQGRSGCTIRKATDAAVAPAHYARIMAPLPGDQATDRGRRLPQATKGTRHARAASFSMAVHRIGHRHLGRARPSGYVSTGIRRDGPIDAVPAVAGGMAFIHAAPAGLNRPPLSLAKRCRGHHLVSDA